MTTAHITSSSGPSTLADALVGRRSLATDAGLVAGGAGVVALFAQISVPLWPVPVTGQTLAVLLVGAALGARRGALALLTYAVAGLAGLPVFASFTGGPAAIFKPSFGFIVGFVFAAALVGWLSERKWDRHPGLAFLGFLGASIVPFVFGLPYMAFVLAHLGMAHDLDTIVAAGVTPFLLGGAIKWLIAAASLPLIWRASGRA
ncbi:biotin transporter BioY [Microbacterium fluvii]|uniref:Biotin transporter n=1 Tax=Microbacterium fluvii TaxID=415215 RepID=A0ABW2H9K9_9MICO|nr:biotin transporter BioY [Microbacterium fluvii]MCU4671155.1 biotin transporter BioY [Microbacterium fluvii]